MNAITSRSQIRFRFRCFILIAVVTSKLHLIGSLPLATLIVLFVCPATTRSQDLDNVSINGRVLDQNGALVAGATVTAVLTQTLTQRSAVSDLQGRYRLFQMSPGRYSVAVSCAGFALQEKTEIGLAAGEKLQLDFVLGVQDLIATPVVINSGDVPAIDTTRTVVGGTVLSRDVESLPNTNRSPLDLLFILPGVTEEPLSTRDLAEDRNATHASTPEEAGTFAISGGAAYSNNITIDGLDNNDDRAARERFEPSLESLEEVQVITNQFSSEYGRASGGRINIRTRGGSTQFRGRAYYFFKDESLNANTFRNNSLGLKRLPFQEHTAGLILSGPLALRRDRDLRRTYFLVSYELNKVLDHALVDTLVPVQQNSRFVIPSPTTLVGRRGEDANLPALSTELAPFVSSLATPQRVKKVTGRLDHQFNETHNGTVLVQLGTLTNLRGFNGGNRLAETLEAQTRNSESVSYSDTLVFSATQINQARIQYSSLRPAFKSDHDRRPVVLIAINDPLATSDSARRSATLVAGSSTVGATDRKETRLQLQDVFSMVQGSHSVKFGLDAQRISSTFVDLTDATGTFTFASAGDFLANAPTRYRQSFLTESTQWNSYFGLFVQDEWRVSQTAVLNFGLRYERESILDDRNNFAPRVSLAYDPSNSGKNVIRAGVGIFYNRALLRTIDDFTLGTQKLFFDTNTLRDPATNRLLNSDQRRTFIAANLSFPNTLSIDSPLVQQFAQRNDAFVRRLDPELRIPESYQANLGFERDLGSGFVLETNLTFNRGIHLWREFNANAAVLPLGFRNFSEYLASRDFPNFPNSVGLRPLLNGVNAGQLVRFAFGPSDQANPNAVGRTVEFGVPVSLINLNSFSSSTAIEVALAAINHLRPDPTHAEVEQLISAGNSFYRGLTVQLQRRFAANAFGRGFSFRAAYTLSRLIDDGVVNTSDALIPGDFRSERARSLLDRRHRFVFSGTFDLPSFLGSLRVAPIWRLASGAPFNISLGGADRNLDDVGNDRPMFSGDTKRLRWRGPGQQLDPSLPDLFAQPTIGQTGNMPRNAGHGPGLFLLDLNITREFRLSEKVTVRPAIEFDNILNKTVFSFGSEFINFTALSPSATSEQRQALLDSFLLTTRTLRQRQIRLGLRVDF